MFGLDYVDFPPAQRLRPAPEHRRPLSQRDRHLHESDSAGPADDDLRRRHADARVQLHRRRRAAHGRSDRRRPRRATRCSTSAPTCPVRSTTWRWRLPRRWASRPTSSTSRRGSKCSTRTPRTTRFAASSATRPQTSLQDGLAQMAAWVRGHGARAERAVRRHRDPEEPAGCVAALMTQLSRGAPDGGSRPAHRLGRGRASSCRVRAAGGGRARNRRRLLRLDQPRARRAAGRRRHLAGAAGVRRAGRGARGARRLAATCRSLGACVVRRRARVERPRALPAGRGRRRWSPAWRTCFGLAAVSSWCSRTSATPGGGTSTITRIVRSSPTCRCRRCCARTASASSRCGRSFFPTRCAARACRSRRSWCSAYLRSPFKPMAGQMLVVAARD